LGISHNFAMRASYQMRVMDIQDTNPCEIEITEKVIESQ
jgi:hypothetical protein